MKSVGLHLKIDGKKKDKIEKKNRTDFPSTLIFKTLFILYLFLFLVAVNPIDFTYFSIQFRCFTVIKRETRKSKEKYQHPADLTN